MVFKGRLLNILVAVGGISVIALQFVRPELKIDPILFVYFIIVVLALFGPPLQLKDVEYFGLKLGTEPHQEPAVPPVQERAANLTASTPQYVGDDFMTRLVKLTPSDMITIYLVIVSMMISSRPAHTRDQQYVLWTIFGIFCILTPMFLRFVGNVGWRQLFVSTLIFAVWAFTLPGPFWFLSWYDPTYGALALLIIAFGVPLIRY